MSGDLVAHLATFGRALRARGLGVGLSEEVDGASALALVDLLDRDEVRSALHSAMRIRRDDWAVFDELFDHLWFGEEGSTSAPRPPRPERRPSLPRGGAGPRFAPGDSALPGERNDGDHPGYSPDAMLRKKPFDQCTPRDLADMERLLARLSLKLATRPSRRFVPTRGRGLVDLRRSFRNAVGTQGELLSLARRARAAPCVGDSHATGTLGTLREHWARYGSSRP